MNRTIIAVCTAAGLAAPALAGSIQVYTNDFSSWDSQVLAPGVSTAPGASPGTPGGFLPLSGTIYFASASSQSFHGLGPASNPFSGNMLVATGTNAFMATRLTLLDLPQHTSLSMSFLLAIIDKWNVGADSRLEISVDGVIVFNQLFDTTNPTSGYNVDRIATGAFFGPGTVPDDSAYNMLNTAALQNIPHSAPTATIQFVVRDNISSARGFGLDNLLITLDNPVVIPLPTAATMSLAGLGMIALRRRR